MEKNKKKKYYNKQTNSYYYKKNKNNNNLNKSNVKNETLDLLAFKEYTLSTEESDEIKKLIDLEVAKNKDNIEELDTYVEQLEDTTSIEELENRVLELERLIREKEENEEIEKLDIKDLTSDTPKLDLELDENINTISLDNDKTIQETINNEVKALDKVIEKEDKIKVNMDEEVSILKRLFGRKKKEEVVEELDLPILKDRSDEIETLDLSGIENKVNEELAFQEKVDNLELTHMLEKVNKNLDTQEKLENLELTHMLDKVNNKISEEVEELDTDKDIDLTLTRINEEINDKIELLNLEENEVRDNIINRLDNTEEVEKDNNKKSKLSPIEITIIIVTFIIVLGSILVFLFRGIFYYNKEHEIKENTLNNVLINEKNIIYSGDGLYQDKENENNYYFKGLNVNNYVIYKGITWRILNVSDKVNMIMEDSLTTLTFGKSENYKDSIVNEYLDNYLKTIDSEDLLTNKYCDSTIDVNNYNCENYNLSKIGLLSTEEFLKYGGKNSYLNNNSYFYTLNYDKDNNKYFINKDGSINNISNNEGNYFSYGIRPVISISRDLVIESGDGTMDTPYIIVRKEIDEIKNANIGDYVKYNNLVFRISNKDSDGITLLSNELLEEKDYNSVYKYLNNEFIKNFNKEELIKQDYYLDTYNLDNNYNYKENKNKNFNYIILPSIGTYFLNDLDNYFINNMFNNDLIYTVKENNTIFSDLKTSSYKIRYMIKINNDLVISNGQGTLEDPYVIGEINEE